MKSSLLKLFFTISRLYEVTPLQQFRLDFFWLNLPCVPDLTIAISQFIRAEQHNKDKGTKPMSLLRFTTFSPQLHFAHAFTFYLYPSKEISMSVLRHSASLRATGGTFPLHCVKCFLCSITLFFLRYFHDGRGKVGVFYMRRSSMDAPNELGMSISFLLSWRTIPYLPSRFVYSWIHGWINQ